MTPNGSLAHAVAAFCMALDRTFQLQLRYFFLDETKNMNFKPLFRLAKL